VDRFDVESLVLEILGNQLAELGIIIDDENRILVME
jgi:hypothetical protein